MDFRIYKRLQTLIFQTKTKSAVFNVQGKRVCFHNWTFVFTKGQSNQAKNSKNTHIWLATVIIQRGGKFVCSNCLHKNIPALNYRGSCDVVALHSLRLQHIRCVICGVTKVILWLKSYLYGCFNRKLMV